MWPSSAPAPKPPRKRRSSATIGAADAGADRERDHVAHQAAGAVAELGPARGVGVVLDDDGQVDPAPQPLADGLVPPVDVRGVVHGGLRGVDEAGGRDAHGDHVRVPGAQALDHGDDGLDDGVRAARLRGRPLLGRDGAQLVDHRSRDLGPADVDPDCMHVAGPSVGLASRSY
jgi:hypothetical protein